MSDTNQSNPAERFDVEAFLNDLPEWTAQTAYAPTVHAGNMRICDVRGWGHLTGQGQTALGLSGENARAVQDAICRRIAAIPDMLAVLRVVVADGDACPCRACSMSRAVLAKIKEGGA